MKASLKTVKSTNTLVVPNEVAHRMQSICDAHEIAVPDFIVGALMSAIITFEKHSKGKNKFTKKPAAKKAPAKKAPAKKAAAKKPARKKVVAKKVAVKKAPAKKTVGRPRKGK